MTDLKIQSRGAQKASIEHLIQDAHAARAEALRGFVLAAAARLRTPTAAPETA
ncbi:MAG: hypothetical protein AAF684_07565 [Pseudomonadota bacterium]